MDGTLTVPCIDFAEMRCGSFFFLACERPPAGLTSWTQRIVHLVASLSLALSLSLIEQSKTRKACRRRFFCIWLARCILLSTACKACRRRVGVLEGDILDAISKMSEEDALKAEEAIASVEADVRSCAS